MDELGVKISLSKLKSGAMEFAKGFFVGTRDLYYTYICKEGESLSPAVMNKDGCNSFLFSLRLRGAGYRLYAIIPSAAKHFNCHWYKT